MANEVSAINITESAGGVVVQTIARAMLKTFVQAFVSGLALTFTPWLLDLSQTLSNGGHVSLGDANVGGKLILAAAVGALSALISWAMNYFGEKTLPGTVQAVTTVPPPK